MLGGLYKAQREYQNAIDVLSRFVQSKTEAGEGSDKGAAMAYYNIACYYALQAAKRGDANAKRAAYENLRRSIELDPDSRKDAKLDVDFESLAHEDDFRIIVTDS